MPEKFSAFSTPTEKNPLPILAMTQKDSVSWFKKAPATTRHRAEQSGFIARPGQVLTLYNSKGTLESLLVGINQPLQVFDLAVASETLARLPEKILKTTTFRIDGLTEGDAEKACIGWGLASYRFEDYKSDKKTSALPRLVWPEGVDKKSVLAQIESACLIRTLINTPANDMGPDELENSARALAEAEGMTIKVIKDKDLLKNNFPMIYAVGKGSSRRPRLIDLHWGNTKHPKVTLVGKGVCFDTGGLDIKPPSAMYTMKKDMGGGAHVLGLALLIIRHKLPVRLRVLIPAVENSISGDAYRPSDILQSRKGLTVEVGDTDAEGRLVLADALALACEEKPDLLINLATLTGAARVALGVDVPAVFSNRESLAFALKDHGAKHDDPLWPLPLWQGYVKDMASDIADVSSTGVGKAGAITAALFLEKFVTPETEWAHIDLYAWNDSARPGRTKGGMEMTTRAVFSYLADRY